MKLACFYKKRLEQTAYIILFAFCFSIFVSSCNGGGNDKTKDDTQKKDEPKNDEKNELMSIYWRPIDNSDALNKIRDMKCGDDSTYKWKNVAGYNYITIVIQNNGTCKVLNSITPSGAQADKKQMVPIEPHGEQVRIQDAPAKGESVDISFHCESDKPDTKCDFSFQISGGFENNPADTKGTDSVSGDDMNGITPKITKGNCITEPVNFLDFINMSKAKVMVSFKVTNLCQCSLKINRNLQFPAKTDPDNYAHTGGVGGDHPITDFIKPYPLIIPSKSILKCTAKCDNGNDNNPCKFKITNITVK